MWRPLSAALGVMVVSLSGCGRLGYDAVHGAGDGDLDAQTAPDGPAGANDARDGADAGPDGPDSGPGGQIMPVAADIDDGMIRDGVHSMTGDFDNAIHMGRSGSAPSWGYFRFAVPVAIPSGATIDVALLRVPAAGAGSWDDSSYGLRIFVEDTPDAGDISDARETPDGTTPGWTRYPVATAIDWGAGGLTWPLGTTVTSPDLSAAFQELLQTHDGLASGAHVQVWVRGEGLTADGAVATHDHSAGMAVATLELRWTP